MSDRQIDVAVVGGGMGGIYAAYRFRDAGFFRDRDRGWDDFGGVWYHNAYRGARRHRERRLLLLLLAERSMRVWQWSERYGRQPELMAYLHWVAEKLDVRSVFHFGNWFDLDAVGTRGAALATGH